MAGTPSSGAGRLWRFGACFWASLVSGAPSFALVIGALSRTGPDVMSSEAGVTGNARAGAGGARITSERHTSTGHCCCWPTGLGGKEEGLGAIPRRPGGKYTVTHKTLKLSHDRKDRHTNGHLPKTRGASGTNQTMRIGTGPLERRAGSPTQAQFTHSKTNSGETRKGADTGGIARPQATHGQSQMQGGRPDPRHRHAVRPGGRQQWRTEMGR